MIAKIINILTHGLYREYITRKLIYNTFKRVLIGKAKKRTAKVKAVIKRLENSIRIEKIILEELRNG